MIIDFHTHLASHFLGTALLSLDEFVAGLDRCGVERACVFTLAGFLGETARHNERLAEQARRFPDRLIPFATVDPKEGESAVKELDTFLSDPLFKGVKFHSWLQAFAPSMVRETLTELMHCAAMHQAPVLFHDGTPPYATTFQIARAARWVPECAVVLGHGGLVDYVQPAAQLAREIPNLYCCTCGLKTGDIVHLVNQVGKEKVIFGSDFGVADWTLLAERLDDVRHADLSEDDLEAILGQNAERVLAGLPHIPGKAGSE
jgi:predicted TIM-barrel fold metal-dependent hydrolase